MRTPTMLSWAIREGVACDRQPANERELLAFAVSGCGSDSPARMSLMQHALTLVFSTPLNLTPISRLALRRRNKDCAGLWTGSQAATPALSSLPLNPLAQGERFCSRVSTASKCHGQMA